MNLCSTFTYTLYKIRFELTATMLPQDQHPSHPLPASTNPYITMQQPPLGFHGGSSYLTGPCCPGRPLDQGMMAPRTQHVQQQQYLPPRPGPNRRPNKRRHKARPQKPDQHKHESSGAVSNDRSIGVDPGMSRNNPNNNPGRGKV